MNDWLKSLLNMRCALIFIAAVIFLSNPVMGNCEDTTGNINFVIGTLHCDDDFSKAFNLDNRIELGISSDVRGKNWPVNIAFDYLFSYGDSKIPKNPYGAPENTDITIYCTEMFIGVKKIFALFHSIKPFAAAGIYTVNMYVDIISDNEYEFGVGPWVGSGAYIMLSKHLNIGFEWKWSYAEVTILNHNYNAGGNHFSLIAGYHF